MQRAGRGPGFARPGHRVRGTGPALAHTVVMGPVLVQMVLLGLAAAVAPLPVILAIALLHTGRPVANSVAYLTGGFLVYLVLALAGSEVVAKIAESRVLRHRVSTPVFILMTVIGALFLLLAIITWRRSRPITLPARVNQLLAALGPVRAFGLGLLLCSPGLKNLTLLVAALALLATHGLTFLQAGVSMGLFLAITLAPPAAPLVAYVALPRERAEAMTQGWKAWIEQHARAIIVVVSAAIGAMLVQAGLSGLMS